jgi:signal transduction histidine kinase
MVFSTDMEIISRLVELNRDNIFFAYGLAFFSLGLAIAVQVWHHTRLELVHSLKWLAAFGVAHGFYEWGDIFMHRQADYLSPPWMSVLEVIHSGLLVLSFVCLLQCGLALVLVLDSPTWLTRLRRPRAVISAGLIGLWAGLVWFFASQNPTFNIHTLINGLSRYLLAFPGAVLAAYGLRQQAIKRFVDLNVPSILRNFQVAGIALFIYALLAGLVPPAMPFFPGNWLNTAVFSAMLGLPVVVFRSITALVITISMIRGLEVFQVETLRLVEGMEQQQILAAERERLARDLHDGAIQSVYSAGLLVESAARLVPPETQAAVSLTQAMLILNDAVSKLRENLNTLKPAPAVAPLSQLLHTVAAEPRLRSLVDIHTEVLLPDVFVLSSRVNGHVAAIVNEALSNVVRHAQAQNVWIAARAEAGTLRLTIQDDGVGIARDHHPGYGLRNMIDRARLLGGELRFETVTGRGGCLCLEIPLEEIR